MDVGLASAAAMAFFLRSFLLNYTTMNHEIPLESAVLLSLFLLHALDKNLMYHSAAILASSVEHCMIPK